MRHSRELLFREQVLHQPSQREAASADGVSIGRGSMYAVVVSNHIRNICSKQKCSNKMQDVMWDIFEEYTRTCVCV